MSHCDCERKLIREFEEIIKLRLYECKSGCRKIGVVILNVMTGEEEETLMSIEKYRTIEPIIFWNLKEMGFFEKEDKKWLEELARREDIS